MVLFTPFLVIFLALQLRAFPYFRPTLFASNSEFLSLLGLILNGVITIEELMRWGVLRNNPEMHARLNPDRPLRDAIPPVPADVPQPLEIPLERAPAENPVPDRPLRAEPAEEAPAPENTFRARPAGYTGPWSPLTHFEAEIEELIPASRRIPPAAMRQFSYAVWERMRPGERARYRAAHHRQRGELMRSARRNDNQRRQ